MRIKKYTVIRIVRWGLLILGLLAMAGGIFLTLAGYDALNDLPSHQRTVNTVMAMSGLGTAISGFVMFIAFFVRNNLVDKSDRRSFTIKYMLTVLGIIVLTWGLLLVFAGYGLFVNNMWLRERITAMIVAGFIAIGAAVAMFIAVAAIMFFFDGGEDYGKGIWD